MAQSVMKHNFSEVPKAEIPRSSFNRSHGVKTTFDAGQLIPIFVDEALPGDTFKLNMSGFGRLSTPLHPIMDNLYVSSFFFAVPVRLIWENWQKFHGEQLNPADSTDYTVPQMVSPASVGYTNGSLSDYFGIPTGIPDLSHSSLWHRAYNLIWREWFRDQNLQDSPVVDIDDGPDTVTDYVLLNRGKRHDYFTSGLPWPQKGDAVQIPAGGLAPVIGIGPNTTQSGSPGGAVTIFETDESAGTAYSAAWQGTVSGAVQVAEDSNNLGFPDIRADLSQATAANVNQLRMAFQVQKLLERDARSGTRYTEVIKAHFGVTSPDARLQRPEYLGGGKTPIVVSAVAQTSETTVDSPQGNLAAFATAQVNRHGFTKSFTEHCVLIGLISCQADLTYQQGLNRMFSRSIRWDYYYPALSHVGEQTILNKEIYAQGSLAVTDDLVFGYQERYAEYRYKPSMITGQFRSNFAQTLDTWHLSQNFTSLPTLSDDFIVDKPPIDRIAAVVDYPDLIWDSYFDLQCTRPMPLYGVPGMIDHF